MSLVTENQPDGTPTRIDLGVPDLDRALDFHGAGFGREFDAGPAEFGRCTTAYLDGGRVAAVAPGHQVGRIMGVPSGAWTSWSTTFEVHDTDTALARAGAAGATAGPVDDMLFGRLALITDPYRAGFWTIARPA